MQALDFVQHPYLTQFLKSLAPGEVLFRQGEAADAMYVIVSGRILLLGERGEGTYVAGILEEGQILGEKVLYQTSTYQRALSARAEVETTVLELTPDSLKRIEREDPTVMTALLRSILRVVAVRFERANMLIRLLRSANPIERLVNVILYYRRCSGRVTSEGHEVLLSVDSIHHYIDMEREQIETALGQLVEAGLLVRTDSDRYLIPDEQALLAYSPKLTKKLAA